jgi:hypothetical protein
MSAFRLRQPKISLAYSISGLLFWLQQLQMFLASIRSAFMLRQPKIILAYIRAAFLVATFQKRF